MVVANRLDPSEQVQVSQSRPEREIAAQSQGASINNQGQIRWSITKRWVQLSQCRRQFFQILRGSAIAQIDVVCHSRTSAQTRSRRAIRPYSIIVSASRLALSPLRTRSVGVNFRFSRISDRSTPFSSCSPYQSGSASFFMYSSAVMPRDYSHFGVASKSQPWYYFP